MKILITKNKYFTDQTLTQALTILGYTLLDPILNDNEAIISIENSNLNNSINYTSLFIKKRRTYGN